MSVGTLILCTWSITLQFFSDADDEEFVGPVHGVVDGRIAADLVEGSVTSGGNGTTRHTWRS